MTANTLQRAIMRRVYYSYVLSLVSKAVFWQGLFLGMAFVLLADWLHVASIVNNFLSVPVGQVHHYVLNSFLYALQGEEFIVAVMVLAVGMVSIAVGYQLASLFVKLLPTTSRG